MKRTVTIESGKRLKRTKNVVARRSRLGLYRNPNTAISYVTRSGIVDIPVVGQTQSLQSLGWGIGGYYYGKDLAVLSFTTWNGGSEIASIFDAARLVKVELLFSFSNDTSQANSTAGSNTIPFMYIANDYNDINTGASTVAEILQKPDARQVRLGTGTQCDHYRVVKPKVAQLAFSTSLTSGYLEPKQGIWVNTTAGLVGSFVDVQHYGVKFFVDTLRSSIGSGTNLGYLRVFQKAYYECKHCT